MNFLSLNHILKKKEEMKKPEADYWRFLTQSP
jgi:hypothetical protein